MEKKKNPVKNVKWDDYIPEIIEKTKRKKTSVSWEIKSTKEDLAIERMRDW